MEMFNKYTQTEGKSCGLVALSHLFQRDLVEEGFYPDSANNIPKMSKFIRDEFGPDLGIEARFYDHEGVDILPEYLERLEDTSKWDEKVYGLPLLIQTLGEEEYLNHIFLAVITRDGVEVYDGLEKRVHLYKDFQELSFAYHRFAGVYVVGNDEHLITWFKEDGANNL